MQAAVKDYIDRLSIDSRNRVSKHFAREVGEFAHLSAKLVSTLQRYHAQNPVAELDDPKQVAFALMTKGANTLMASFELVLIGYMKESEVLLRSALEGFAVAWDVTHNPDRFIAWKDGKKFHSTDSISKLTKEIDPVGKLYGYLSNMHVHTTPKNSAPSMFLDGESQKFQFFGFISPGKEHLPKGPVHFNLFTAYVLLQLTELVFHAYSDGLETIEKVPGKDLVRTVVSERHQQFVEAAMNHFRLMAQDPEATLR